MWCLLNSYEDEMLKFKGMLRMCIIINADVKSNKTFMGLYNNVKRLNDMSLHAIQMIKKLKYESDFEKIQKIKSIIETFLTRISETLYSILETPTCNIIDEGLYLEIASNLKTFHKFNSSIRIIFEFVTNLP